MTTYEIRESIEETTPAILLERGLAPSRPLRLWHVESSGRHVATYGSREEAEAAVAAWVADAARAASLTDDEGADL